MLSKTLKMPAWWITFLLLVTVGRCYGDDSSPKLSFTEEEDGVTILADGELFARYLLQSGTRPVIWPINGPTGKPMTRAYPVADTHQGEEKDHFHHRSMWIGYEGMNGNDYWHEPETGGNRAFPLGTEKHRKVAELKADGNTVLLVTENDWLNGDGQPVCSDTRTYQFGSDGKQRWIDCLLELKASSGPLKIGDSKEGFFALRVPSTMRVDEGLGGKIITSAGKTDADAWSKRAKWVDYHGPVEGETLGIAMLSHPKNYNPEPRWHVRTYGLFAPNPFGELAFTKPETDVTKRPLRLTLPEGESLKLRYRVIFHPGDEKQADIAGQFEQFAKKKIDEF